MDLRCSGSDAPMVTRYGTSPPRKRPHADVRSLPRERVRSSARLSHPTAVRERVLLPLLRHSFDSRYGRIIGSHASPFARVSGGLRVFIVSALGIFRPDDFPSRRSKTDLEPSHSCQPSAYSCPLSGHSRPTADSSEPSWPGIVRGEFAGTQQYS